VKTRRFKVFDCYDPDEGDEGDAVAIEEDYPDDAAELFVSRRGVSEESDLNERTVMVREHGSTSPWQKFLVVPEATIVYHVYEN